MEESPCDETLRVWALECAVNSTTNNTKASSIIKRSEQYYGFLTRNKCKIEKVRKKNEIR